MGKDGVEGLISLEQVQRTVLGVVSRARTGRDRARGSLGHVLAADVHAPRDLPPFANTAMDGYAVRAGDTADAPVELR